MNKSIFSKIFFSSLLSIGIAHAAVAAQMTPEYAYSKSRPKTLLIVPSLILVKDDSRKKYVNASKENQALRALVDQTVVEKLKKSGFQVTSLASEELRENKEKEQLYNGVIVEYSKTLNEFLKNQSMLKYNWFGLGRSSAVLADLYQVDALVVSSIVIESEQSATPIVKGELEHRVFVVDGETANFEAAFLGKAKFKNMSDSKRFEKDAKKLVNQSLLEVKNARKRKQTLSPDVELKAKQKFTPIAEEEALLAELNSLIPDVYAPFNFDNDVDEEKLLDDLKELIE